MATVLVTGATGFIGWHLVKRLLEHGAGVRCLTRGAALLPAPAETVRGDYVTGAGLREALAGVHTVFHLAGVTKALRTKDYFTGNVEVTEHLAQAAAEYGDSVRFVHVSSLAAAGPSTGDADVSEQTDPHPVSAYGRSKLAGEQAARRLLPRAVVVRPPVVYGPRDTDVFEMVRGIARGIDLRIGRAERWFSAIYAADLVEGLLAAARCPGAAGKTYFLAHPEPVSWTQFAATAARLLNRRVRTIVVSRAAAAALGSVAGCWSRLRGKPGIVSADKLREALYPRWTCTADLARSELGFVAATTLEEGLAQSIAWYKEHGWL